MLSVMQVMSSGVASHVFAEAGDSYLIQTNIDTGGGQITHTIRASPVTVRLYYFYLFFVCNTDVRYLAIVLYISTWYIYLWSYGVSNWKIVWLWNQIIKKMTEETSRL